MPTQQKIKKHSPCSKHPSKNLKFYCETCKQIICRKCINSNHSDSNHTYLRLEEVAERRCADLELKHEGLESILKRKNMEMQPLIEVNQTLEENMKKAKSVIKTEKIIC